MEPLTTIRPELLTLSDQQLNVLSPYFWVFGGTLVAMIASVIKWFQPKWPVFIITLITCVIGVVASLGVMPENPTPLFNGMMISDRYACFFNILYLVAAGLTALASFRYLDRENLQHPEYNLLLLFSTIGMMLMTSSLDLIVTFIALELMSLAVYVLVGFRRADRKSNEAALKYFILGSAASAVLLYGAALLYGATGTTGMRGILDYIHAHPEGMTPLFTLGAWLVVIGFLFKVAAVPFHMWMPDVYEGAPAPVTGFMTTGLKAAAFGAFIRLFISLGYGSHLSAALQKHLHDIIWIVAVLTMLLGNLTALVQTNLKRMLGFSSISHTGYLLVGLLAGATSDSGYAPLTMYLVAYSIMNIGAFVVLTLMAGRGDQGLNLSDLSGLGTRRPWIAFAMTVFLLSMAGIPPTAGFAAKYMLFYSAIQAHETPLVVIAVLCSAISVYYYLRVLVYMYMRDPLGSASASRIPVWSAAVVAAMVVLTVQIGILPAQLVAAAKRAVTGF